MNTPVVSILMPVYNTALYLREAMDSILSQTFTDFELIVLDDCSPDDAESILDSYTDPRIVRYKGEKNEGLSNVLNVGIGMARGKYIARMDSDDISLPERLQVQVDYLEIHTDVDLASAGMQLFGAKKDIWIQEQNPEKLKIIALFHTPVLHASSMWRKESFEKYGLRYRQEMVPAEDYDLWTRALVKGLKLVNMPNVLYKYRMHPNQATLRTDKTSAKSRIVREEFLKAALPSLSDEKAQAFPEHLWPVFFANLKDGFFDRILLAIRLYKMSRNKR